MEESIFLDREGRTPKNKILDFLITVQDFDYSLKDIAKYADVSYPCIKLLKDELLKRGWIIHTRKVGKAKMYMLNIKSKKVQKFTDFYWSVIDEEVAKILEKDKKVAIEDSERSQIPQPA